MLGHARSGSLPLRRARGLVAAALACGAVGALAALLDGAARTGPSLTHLGFVLLALLALLSYPHADTADQDHGSRGLAGRSLLDGLVAAVAMWFVLDALALRGSHLGGDGLLDQVVALAHPAGDVLVVATALSVLSRTTAESRRELLWLCAGLSVLAVADVAHAVLGSAGTYRPDSWVGLVGEAGLLLLLGAAVARPAATPSRADPVLAVLPFVPVLVAVVTATSLALADRSFSAGQTGASLVLVAALVLRQLVGGRDRLDMTERLRHREELFRSLVTGSSDLITLHDRDGTLVYASPAVALATGVEADALVLRPTTSLIHPDDRPVLASALNLVRSVEGGTTEVPLRVLTHDGTFRWHHTRMRNALEDPAVRGIISNSRDVHERHVLQEQVLHAANHDALTGLGNLTRARVLIAQAFDRPGTTTVALVDLDGFKAVNDTFGHADGDALLQVVGRRLRACVRAEDEVTRIGGDEFLLVLGNTSDGTAVAQRILTALRQPVPVAGRPLAIGASIGLATTAQAAGPEELLRNADLAMYAAKAAGRGRASWYESQMHASAAHRMQVHRGLRRALDDGHLALHYQPIVALPQGQVVGAEALLRWTDPEMGPIGPDVFIPVAEDSGLMGEIDAWVLDRACADLAAWRAQGLVPVPVSINVSRQHLTGDLPALVSHVLAGHDLPASLLTLEITESAVVPDPELAIAVLGALHDLGVRIALDDFGTGQSSLSQLARLPIDTVKIDKSFVLASGQDAGAQRLLSSIIGVCRALELPVVAEGIEDGDVVGYLAANGCEFGQGYHFGRPGHRDLVPGLLRRAALPIPAARVSPDVQVPAAS
jgi:diguanylate cyclase (GGDEF)-like protein/PAS domain S-box-containing protein